MRKRSNEILVDLSSLVISGNILDMGYKGNGIMFRAIKKGIRYGECDEAAVTVDPEEGNLRCDWLSGHPAELPFQDDTFDAVTVFFSLSCIDRKYKRNKTISEVSRVLKKCGNVYLWDFSSGYTFITSKRLKIILPGMETVRTRIESPGYFKSCSMESIQPVMEHYFKIDEASDFGEYYYIRAEK